MPRAIHIRPSNDGQTLATALRKILGEQTPWSEVKRLIAKRHVMLNGNLCVDEGRKVQVGDVLHLHEQSRAPLPTEDDIVIRYIDGDLVVIEKPAGLNTLRHREETDLPQKRKDKAPTLEELLQKKVNAYVRERSRSASQAPHILAGRDPRRGPVPHADARRSPPPVHPLMRGKVAGGKPPPGPAYAAVPATHHAPPPLPSTSPELRPVHRLDRETSGLMMFAFSAPAEHALERDFARHAVERKYLAVVVGQLREPRTIESWILRDRGDGLRGSSPKGKAAESAGAQRALTHVRPVEQLAGYTLVECQLETGRTHQIRIHLSELGHPLAGEKVYLSPLAPPPDATAPARHALHSHHLRFTHPTTGETKEFASPFPRDLEGWVKRLRGVAR